MAADTSDQPAGQPIRVWDVFARAFALYRENFRLFIAIAVIGQALRIVYVALSVTGVRALCWAALAVWCPSIVVALWAGAAMIIAASRKYTGQEVTVKECFAGVEGRYLRYVIATVLYELVSGAGLLLLIVPGIYFAVVFSLAGYVAVLERRHAARSLARSRQLVRGSFWRVFAIGLIRAIPWLAGISIAIVLSELHVAASAWWKVAYWILLWPFWTAVHTVLYYQLKERAWH